MCFCFCIIIYIISNNFCPNIGSFCLPTIMWCGEYLLFHTGETVTIVGDHDPALLKYFDCTRSGPRSAFDNNVVYQFETMEYVNFLLSHV